MGEAYVDHESTFLFATRKNVVLVRGDRIPALLDRPRANFGRFRPGHVDFIYVWKSLTACWPMWASDADSVLAMLANSTTMWPFRPNNRREGHGGSGSPTFPPQKRGLRSPAAGGDSVQRLSRVRAPPTRLLQGCTLVRITTAAFSWAAKFFPDQFGALLAALPPDAAHASRRSLEDGRRELEAVRVQLCRALSTTEFSFAHLAALAPHLSPEVIDPGCAIAQADGLAHGLMLLLEGEAAVGCVCFGGALRHCQGPFHMLLAPRPTRSGARRHWSRTPRSVHMLGALRPPL